MACDAGAGLSHGPRQRHHSAGFRQAQPGVERALRGEAHHGRCDVVQRSAIAIPAGGGLRVARVIGGEGLCFSCPRRNTGQRNGWPRKAQTSQVSG
jgi:hypothetical protein